MLAPVEIADGLDGIEKMQTNFNVFNQCKWEDKAMYYERKNLGKKYQHTNFEMTNRFSNGSAEQDLDKESRVLGSSVDWRYKFGNHQ